MSRLRQVLFAGACAGCASTASPAGPLSPVEGEGDFSALASDASTRVSDSGPVSDGQLWCAVAELAAQRCTGCHSSPPIAGAPMPLTRHEDWRADVASRDGVTVLDAALEQLEAQTMPPPPLEALSPSQVQLFARWARAGAPSQDCSSDQDAGPTGKGAFSGSGEEVYRAVCATCHGAEGQGTEDGSELQHPVRDYAAYVVRNGRPGLEFPNAEMSAYPEHLLSAMQLEEIWDYLESFPQPTTGEGLYRDYCANCHGADAQGGVADRDIAGEDFEDVSENVRQGNGGDNYADRQGFMPAWTAEQLSDVELRQIVEFLATR